MAQECLSSHIAECSGTTRSDKGEMMEVMDNQTTDALIRVFKDGLVKVSCPFLNTETGGCEAGDPLNEDQIEKDARKRPDFPPCVFTKSYTN